MSIASRYILDITSTRREWSHNDIDNEPGIVIDECKATLTCHNYILFYVVMDLSSVGTWKRPSTLLFYLNNI